VLNRNHVGDNDKSEQFYKPRSAASARSSRDYEQNDNINSTYRPARANNSNSYAAGDAEDDINVGRSARSYRQSRYSPPPASSNPSNRSAHPNNYHDDDEYTANTKSQPSNYTKQYHAHLQPHSQNNNNSDIECVECNVKSATILRLNGVIKNLLDQLDNLSLEARGEVTMAMKQAVARYR
jgi:hypothetical protein